MLWLALGIALGVLGAIHAGGVVDRAITVLAMVGVSAPVFVVGALLLYLFAVKLPVFPDGGYVPLTRDPLGWLHHMILPWCTLSVLFVGFYSRVLRGTMLEMGKQDFVRTARAKGIGERRVLVRHVLRNSLLPIVALWGLDFAAVVGGGTILAESIFDLHGVGQYAADSIAQLDVPPVLVMTLLGASFVVLLNAVTDVLFALLDPRVRLEA